MFRILNSPKSWKNIGVSLSLVLFLVGCATVGPSGVEINADDTWVTVATAFLVFVLAYILKKEVDLIYFKREKKIEKKLLDKEDV